MQESQLIPVGQASKPLEVIQQSRVANKWQQTISVLGTVKNCLDDLGIGLQAEVIFANKGVLLNRDFNMTDMQILEQHNQLYENAVSQQLESMGIDHNYYDYDDFDVHFPSFVNLKNPVFDAIGGNLSLIEMLNNYFQQFEGERPPIINNRDNRHCINGLSEMQGMNKQAIFWLLAGYLAFDHKIAPHIGEKGIYMVAERFEPLFRITKLTPSLKALPKIKINA